MKTNKPYLLIFILTLLAAQFLPAANAALVKEYQDLLQENTWISFVDYIDPYDVWGTGSLDNPKNMEAFAEALRDNNNLTQLALYGRDIKKSNGISMLADALKNNLTLKELTFNSANVFNQSDLNALLDMLTTNTTLTKIDFLPDFQVKMPPFFSEIHKAIEAELDINKRYAALRADEDLWKKIKTMLAGSYDISSTLSLKRIPKEVVRQILLFVVALQAKEIAKPSTLSNLN